jgi:hypothetical protein
MQLRIPYQHVPTTACSENAQHQFHRYSITSVSAWGAEAYWVASVFMTKTHSDAGGRDNDQENEHGAARQRACRTLTHPQSCTQTPRQSGRSPQPGCAETGISSSHHPGQTHPVQRRVSESIRYLEVVKSMIDHGVLQVD